MSTTPTRLRRPTAAWLVLFSATAAIAQVGAPADAARAAERIQREEQDRQRQQFLQDQQRRGPTTSLEVPAPASGSAPASSGCVDIREIAIDGAPHLPEADRSRIGGMFTGRCLGVADIEKILAEITRSYIDRGYATARAYIQQQDASRERLGLLVVEGVVEKIVLRGAAQKTVLLGTAFPGLENQPLNLRALEQGLNQINRLASNNATLDIAPGEKPGGSVVTIDNTPGRPFALQLTADNQGSGSTGRDQLGATVSVDNPLGLNDFLSFTHRQTLPADAQRRQALADSLSYIVPYGYSTWTLGWNRSSYVSTLSVPSGLQLRTHGNSLQGFVRADRLVYQDHDSRVAVAATLTAKNSRNFLSDALIAVSSRKLTVADLDANWSTAAFSGVLGLELGWSHGLKAFDALSDVAGLPADAPRAQFSKIRYGANFLLPFKLLDRDARFSTALSGQRAQDPLYSSEQISVAGIYAVRGFFDSSLLGDDGFSVRNDLSLALPVSLPGGTAALVRPYVGVDYGRASSKAAGNLEGSVAGAAVGVALAAGRFDFDIFYARSLHQPTGMPKEAGKVFATLRMRI